mmetsp:Transcript_17062/g.26344  ORF Transcript_17062/g.26344 Transcript_17062/m.26344 type:complete len:186 (-) Transcript_17062:30-587(-)
MAPEILPYQHSLVEDICKLINSKDREIAMRARETVGQGDERFNLNIMRMELERVKFTLKAYLRSRIVKVERFLFYLIERDQAHLLSEAEAAYAFNLFTSKQEYMNSEFFSKISEKLNRMSEDSNMPAYMLTKPNPKQFVFIRFLISKKKHTVLECIDIELKEDNIYFLPFDQIKDFLERGEAELV